LEKKNRSPGDSHWEVQNFSFAEDKMETRSFGTNFTIAETSIETKYLSSTENNSEIIYFYFHFGPTEIKKFGSIFIWAESST
jgi:hypothetical protein